MTMERVMVMVMAMAMRKRWRSLMRWERMMTMVRRMMR
jgi:hypothetical protein